MTPWIIAIILKPAGLIVLLGIAHYGKRLAFRLPDSRIKKLLFFNWRI